MLADFLHEAKVQQLSSPIEPIETAVAPFKTSCVIDLNGTCRSQMYVSFPVVVAAQEKKKKNRRRDARKKSLSGNIVGICISS